MLIPPPKRGKIDPMYASEMKVHPESVTITAKIDAAEGRDVANVDIPGAYMKSFTWFSENKWRN